MKLQCCFLNPDTNVRCPVMGEPEDDSPDTFSCDACLDRLDQMIRDLHQKNIDRHSSN